MRRFDEADPVSSAIDSIDSTVGSGRPSRRFTEALGVSRLLLPERPSPRALLSALRRRFRLRADGSHEQRRTILDTFDWRFQARHRQLELVQGAGAAELRLQGPPGEPSLQQFVARAPDFALELTPGPLRSEAERIAEVRRFVPLAIVEERIDAYRVVDDEEKAVVRLYFEHSRARDPARSERLVELPAVLCVAPVRGYRKPYWDLCRFLRDVRGLVDAPDRGHCAALEALGVEPATSRKWLPAMGFEESAAPLALAIQRGLLATMRANEDGIRGDSDIEHLHDYRVAVRRSRTLLRTFSALLVGSELDRLREELQWLGNETGPTRDADVHLLALRELTGALPRADRDALSPLIDQLRARRREAWTRLVCVLGFSHYAKVLDLLEAFVDPEGPVARGLPAEPTIGAFATEQLARSQRRLLKRGRKLRKDSPDRDVHRVRIQGKRLRYLLEFFRGLYPADVMDAPIKTLRRLQDELGAFNDASVQTQVVRELARSRAAVGEASADELVAVGRLVERLSREKESHRRRAYKRFVQLESSEAWRGFEELCERRGERD